ncbi:MAG: hypothetical protein ACXAEU_16910, partial [Candidatus Hodarchaeales archaeon]
TKIMQVIVDVVKSVYSVTRGGPRRIYDALNNGFMRFNSIISSIIIGNQRLENRSVSFFRKVIAISLALGIWTFLGGIFVIATQTVTRDITTQDGKVFLAAFFLFILVTFGFGVGIVELLIIVRVLDIVSKGKYLLAAEET